MDDKKLLEHEERLELMQSRENKVVKHNDLVQKSRFSLSLTEQKTINFLISLIKPKRNITDIQPLEYEFDIKQYCKICGIDYKNGENYKMVRQNLKSLRDKSVIMMKPDGTETSVSWINKFWSNKGKGWAKIRFDEDIAPYLFELLENTTRYQLLNILPMKSKYSVRLYEICRSWAGLKSHTYEIEELRKLLYIQDGELVNFKDLRRRVLEVAQREINEYTDLNVYFEPVSKGRKVEKIRIRIKEKPETARILNEKRVNEILDN